MPNKNVYNKAPGGFKVQVYGSDASVPIQVDEDGNIKVSIPMDDAGNVRVSLPGGTVMSLEDLTITSMPDVVISGLSLSDGSLSITGIVGLETGASVAISGLNINQDGTITVALTPLENGCLPITGTVSLEADSTVSISGLEPLAGMLPITGIVGLDPQATVSLSGLDVNDGALMVSLTSLIEGALPVQISGTPTVVLNEPIDVYIRPIPVTSEVIPITVTSETGQTIFLKARNYQQTFTPITEGYDTRNLSAYTYLIQIENIDKIDNVSFVAIEELEYEIGGVNYFTYTTNKTPEHLLPFNGAIRLHNPTPDSDAINSRVSLMAYIEDLEYRDNASYRHPALVVHDLEMEVEIAASVYLIAKNKLDKKTD